MPQNRHHLLKTVLGGYPYRGFESHPLDVYIEGLTRTNATGYLTFTPLKGINDVVHSFISECAQP